MCSLSTREAALRGKRAAYVAWTLYIIGTARSTLPGRLFGCKARRREHRQESSKGNLLSGGLGVALATIAAHAGVAAEDAQLMQSASATALTPHEGNAPIRRKNYP